MNINTKTLKTEGDPVSLLKKPLWYFGKLAVTSVLLSTFLSSAEAVVFFKDDFERVTLNETLGAWGNIRQDQLNSGADLYKTTRVWTSATGLELQANGVNGFNAKSGKYRVELDTSGNSSMYTKVNLVNGQSYTLKFHYASIPKTTTTKQCLLLICWPVTTKTYVGGGLRAAIESPSYTTGYYTVGDAATWTQASTTFTYWGLTGEATLKIEATGPSDSFGTSLDDVSLETTILGSVTDTEKAEALTGILPPHVPGLLSQDTNRSDIITPVVRDKQAAIALGKALFWDKGVGSDHLACASCHFHAGADNRIKNQIAPGITHAVASGSTFENTVSGNKSGPNYTLTKADFPFNPNSDDVSSSSGTFSGTLQTLQDTDEDGCARNVDAVFHVNGVGTRKVEPRNTPTTINAAYNFRNFWDGRANNEFNGVSPFGRRDTAAGVYINKSSGPVKLPLKLKNSSLASQAVGPVLSDLEMSCRARQFADVGRKMLKRIPLKSQTIAADDSVLSALPSMIGSTGTYATLIQKAFAPEYWNGNCGSSCGAPGTGVSPTTPYNHMEANFSMYFGIAVQLYEETLISDNTRFDKWKRGLVSATAEEQRGESIFNGKGSCNSCHNGPTMTSAAFLQKDNNLIEGMLMKNGSYAIYDHGFYNLGVVPTDYDIGTGGKDPWGNPLSFTRQYVSDVFVDSFGVEPCKFDLDNGLCANSSAVERAKRNAAVDGSFKVPTLRNVALTGPYFHNGSLSTLEQVVDFYNRGGNFNNLEKHPDIKPLGLSAQEKSDLVAFLKTLTDDRVLYQKAPFDHPSLIIPNGHAGNQTQVTKGNYLFAEFGQDEVVTLPAIGRNGSSQALPTFESGLPGATTSIPTTPDTTPSFNLALSSSTLSIPFLGTQGSITVTVAPTNSFTGSVTFSYVSGLPFGYSYSLQPVTVNSGGSTKLTLNKSLLALIRPDTVTFKATSGSIVKTFTLKVTY